MIQNFADAETELIWSGRRSRKLPADIQKRRPAEVAPPESGSGSERSKGSSWKPLEALKADRQGERSIRINDRWRICFIWDEGGPRDVEIVDYHG